MWKGKLVFVNWALSLVALCIDTECSPLWAVVAVVLWFVLSSAGLLWAERMGWLDEVMSWEDDEGEW